MRIGYLSSHFCQHSIGWLVRGVIQHHQHEVTLYQLGQQYDPLFEYYQTHYEMKVFESRDAREIASEIEKDKLDFLIDLESISSDLASAIVLLHPARYTVSWLGWDAPGWCDYMIADRVVVPPKLKDLYREQIIYMPDCYLACEGFEIGLPSIRRENLGIPADAFVYGIVSTPFKINGSIDFLKTQFSVLKENTEALIAMKIKALTTHHEEVYRGIAADMGIDPGRIKFMPLSPNEAVARADLREVVDCLLDTYPYNGTTGTLEALWLDIPVVSRYGEQFASRQGLAIGAGINDGCGMTSSGYDSDFVKSALYARWNRGEFAHHRSTPLWDTRSFCANLESALLNLL